MAAFPPPGQPPPERPEIVRRQQIAAIADPTVRAELQAILKNRDTDMANTRRDQQQRHPAEREELATVVKNSRNGPRLTPSDQREGPLLGEAGQAKALAIADGQLATRNNAELDRIKTSANQNADKRLDRIYGPYVPDPKHERKLNDYEKVKAEVLSFKPSDPNDRSR